MHSTYDLVDMQLYLHTVKTERGALRRGRFVAVDYLPQVYSKQLTLSHTDPIRIQDPSAAGVASGSGQGLSLRPVD